METTDPPSETGGALLIHVGDPTGGTSTGDELLHAGYEVLPVDAVIACRLLESGTAPRMVLVDYAASAPSALQALVACRNGLSEHVPVVACCAVIDDVDRAIQAGADDFIVTVPVSAFRSRLRVLLRQQNAGDTLSRVLNCTFDGVLTVDAQGTILTFNRAASTIFGYEPAEVLGKSAAMLVPESERSWLLERLKHYRGVGTSQQLVGVGREMPGLRKNGERFILFMHASQVSRASQRIFVGVLRDMSAEARVRALQYEVMHDPLTRLPNRRFLRDRLQQTQASCRETKRLAAILFLGLDHFKNLNDTLGHDAGDQLLIEVAERIRQGIRGSDTAIRFGGDEFLVVLEGLSSEAEEAAREALSVADKLRQLIRAPVQLPGGNTHQCCCSVGLGVMQACSDRVDELIRQADTAMQEAKRLGRDMTCLFDPGIHAAIQARQAMEAALRRALPEGQLSLFYQKQVDQSGRILGAEALLRWRHPVLGQVSPVDFIPIAEQTGLIVDIGLWVLWSACMKLREWAAMPSLQALSIAVNVSPRQFREPDFVERVHRILVDTDINPARLKLELTEGLVLANVSDAVAKMNELRAMGISFSMDDFGTGYSSLSYLTRLPLNQLKIDQSFVRNISSSTNDAVVVQTIIGMARNLGFDVIAEGVETEDQRTFLEENGCESYQGYLFGRPVPIDVFEGEFSCFRAGPEGELGGD